MKEINLNNAQDSNDVLEVIFEKNFKTNVLLSITNTCQTFFKPVFLS